MGPIGLMGLIRPIRLIGLIGLIRLIGLIGQIRLIRLIMRKIYGWMMAGAAILMTGCSAEDVTKEVTPGDAVAISFSCNQEEDITRGAYQGAMNIEDLYTTGFGVFASVTAGEDPGDNKPDLMYNQEVEFTFVGDMENPLKGYWSYQPVKYWPADMSHFYMSAYAPYVDPSELNASGTGIIGLSTNTEKPYVEYRRCDSPQSCVDLLWYYASPTKIPEGTASQAEGTLNMKMRHALARVAINVALAAPAVNTKVLVEEIRLTGKMAKTGRLHLYEQTTVTEGENPSTVTKYYPVWSHQTYDKNDGGEEINHTILINNKEKKENDENNTASYGIIDSQIRYIEGMPYAWQPEGLKAYTPENVEDNGLRNALSTGDRQTYIYLIPQGTLSLEVKVKYHKMTSGGDDDEETTVVTPISISPFKGNKTYKLNLKLTLAPPAP